MDFLHSLRHFTYRKTPTYYRYQPLEKKREIAASPNYFIRLVDNYDDERFHQNVLDQHGAFLVESYDRGFLIARYPVEFEIISKDTAVVRGLQPAYADQVIARFRYYAEHITTFSDEQGNLLAQFEPVALRKIMIDEIQPSIIYVSTDKKAAVRNFVQEEKDIIIPILPFEGRYIAIDGHSRLSVGADLGFTYVYGFETESFNPDIYDHVRRVQKYHITHIQQMKEGTRSVFESQFYCFLISAEEGGLEADPNDFQGH